MKMSVFNYSVQNSSDEEELQVYIDGAIVDAETQQMYKNWLGDDTSVSFKSFRDQVNAANPKKLTVTINSPGGHVVDAMAIHDLIVELKGKGVQVKTQGRGLIASAATYILMAGDSEMSANSWLMIHNVSGGVYGDVNEIEQYAAVLRKFNDSARDFYAEYTGLRKEDITKMMNAETWMTAEEAKSKGFINGITGKVSFEKPIPAENWAYANKAVLNIYNQSVKTKMENFKFQKALATAKADAFAVVDGGFLLTEEHLTEIENSIATHEATQTEIANLKGERDSLTNSLAAEKANVLNAQAEITRLQAEVDRLGAATPPPGGTNRTGDPFHNPRPMSEVTMEANRLRAEMGLAPIQ